MSTKWYLARYTPMEPYFFGNEKNFLYPGQKVGQLSNSYFIRSEDMPSQTTLFGSLRFLLSPVKKAWGQYTDTDREAMDAAIGANSFCFDCEKQTFGKICHMSSVVLLCGDEILVPTPFDHVCGNAFYTPFSEYCEMETAEGTRLYTPQYNAKHGIEKSFMRLSDGAIVGTDAIFRRVIRVGNNLGKNKNGFFKKEYVSMDSAYALGVYVQLEEDLVPQNATAFLGQGKSLFVVSFTPCDGDPVDSMLARRLRPDTVYCRSDSFVKDSVYPYARFAVTDTKTHRAYITDKDGCVTKNAVLHKLLRAGSVLIPRDRHALLERLHNEHAQTVGFNMIVCGQEGVQ